MFVNTFELVALSKLTLIRNNYLNLSQDEEYAHSTFFISIYYLGTSEEHAVQGSPDLNHWI